MPRPLGDPARHFWMTRSVARVMGLSLAEEMRCGRLEAEEYARMVTSCRGCPVVSSCESWLGRQTCIAASAPQGCCISATLARLRRRH
ncbi:hypothetical protein KO516_23495 [Citreicella sp. C3M06]|uniref:DUF6455 family protein n=1 Tax=Roseobacteraceae TaxID=2854170 RepID=UPI001C084674|nr:MULTISPECIES: DUF6455 family protein [Roseobacteraceae]MBU2963739.1 hypothetical protein [Citreicella sp. C3M06]MDO6584803.1 DUF6455 family protein [Salipiger sp. 1_MG-2023]